MYLIDYNQPISMSILTKQKQDLDKWVLLPPRMRKTITKRNQIYSTRNAGQEWINSIHCIQTLWILEHLAINNMLGSICILIIKIINIGQSPSLKLNLSQV